MVLKNISAPLLIWVWDWTCKSLYPSELHINHYGKKAMACEVTVSHLAGIEPCTFQCILKRLLNSAMRSGIGFYLNAINLWKLMIDFRVEPIGGVLQASPYFCVATPQLYILNWTSKVVQPLFITSGPTFIPKLKRHYFSWRAILVSFTCNFSTANNPILHKLSFIR